MKSKEQEMALRNYNRRELEAFIKKARIIEIKDDDYRSPTLPCYPFGEKVH